ncbi:MAG TPA: acetoacetate--CoA ligase [Mycobacteriales bacterium]|nr:acetoacetate--CoA ligase [Mycobacteriales bacterium]HVX69917.1 acetoacetate--CoA ligase [Mycobacteriales bacterium]
MTAEGDLLWTPSAERVAGSRMTDFRRWLQAERGLSFDSYADLHRWSVEQLDEFWGAFDRWSGVRWSTPPDSVLAGRQMPGATWFPGGRTNYAEHLLYPLRRVELEDVAVVAAREDGREVQATWRDLRTQVASVRNWMAQQGIARGDRVVALLPNGIEALVAMLATASLGAIWASCSPDFGPTAIADRFTQIEPTLMIAVDGYHYGGKRFEITGTVEELRTKLPTLRNTVVVSYLDESATLPAATPWAELLAVGGSIGFEPMSFDDPLWVLYSSGTTGLPKPILHGHGGILLEHAKQLALHLDLGPGDRFFWFSTTGWMMWNLLVSGLAVGASIVLYDGNPAFPDQMTLWRLAERTGITCMGLGAPFIQACEKAGLRPAESVDLSAVKTVGSTGAPLSPEGFAWVYEAVGGDVMLSSLSGGTDVCTAFVGGAPDLPVRAGVIPASLLGCAVVAYDEGGHQVIDEVGELVITEPMPSMPVGFWNDPDGSRLRASYYDTFPGVWRHGDWVKFAADGSCVIYGRSDSTLNRGGVRMGTSEFYRVVESLPDVVDSLVIDTSAAGVEGQLLLFVVLREGASLEAVTAEVRTVTRSQLSPRHVPDKVIAVAAVPRTINGKKCEVPVKRVLAGVPLDKAVSRGALADPSSMAPFVELCEQPDGS